MNPFQHLVSEYARLTREAKAYPLGNFPPTARAQVSPNVRKALIFSPHPDDEVIIGGLALRLLRESGWNVVNVAVTLGSNKERQAGRLQELRNCCEFVGFDLEQTGPSGLERVNPKTRGQDPDFWARSVREAATVLAKHRPNAIFFPHELDWNSTHIGTHYLMLDALKSLPASFSCFTVETEFWGQMANPNLMVELTPEQVGDLISGLTCHVGEVKRNPYHLFLPAWMMDNVRRGSELVGGQGGAAPDFLFATLYRLRQWKGGAFADVFSEGRQLTASEDPASLFP